MYSSFYWSILIQLQECKKEIKKCKKENQRLQEQLQSLQPIRIDKMEYKIQELVVKTLSGTLNIGLTAHGDPESVQQLIDQMVKENRIQTDIGTPNPKEEEKDQADSNE